MPALPRTPANIASWTAAQYAHTKRQGALSGVTQGAEEAGKSGYQSVKSATSSLSTGQIVGAGIAIFVGLVLVCLMLWYLCIRRLRPQRHTGTNYNQLGDKSSKSSSTVHVGRTAAVPYHAGGGSAR